MNHAPAPSNSVISLRGVTKTYTLHGGPARQLLGYLGIGRRGVPQKQALVCVDLDIQRGERVGIVGHNGSGKTTLLRLVGGYTAISEGMLRVDGRVDALMQTGYGFNDDLSGIENIRNVLVYHGLDTFARTAAEADIIDFVELGVFLDHPVKTYSLGMRTRLEFAVATAIQPEILVIDEVLGAGDGYFVRKCAERMRRVVDGTTLLLVSHSLDQIREYCQRVVWMGGGRVRRDGPVDEVLPLYRQHMARRTGAFDAAAAVAAGAISQEAIDRVLSHAQPPTGGAATPRFDVDAFGYVDAGVDGVFFTGDAVSLALVARVDADLTPCLLGFTQAGALLFELVLHPYETKGGGVTEWRFVQPRCGIGVGSYVIAPAARDAGGVLRVVAPHALPLVMASTNWSEPPLLHMNGLWTSGASHDPIDAKISAWV